MIRNVNRFDIPERTLRRSPGRRPLTPEEDSIILGDDDDDIDVTLPADLWFRDRRVRGQSASFRLPCRHA